MQRTVITCDMCEKEFEYPGARERSYYYSIIKIGETTYTAKDICANCVKLLCEMIDAFIETTGGAK